MNIYKTYYVEQNNNPDIMLKIREDLTSNNSIAWQDLYWATKYLFENDHEGKSDKIIIDGLEDALSRGLNCYNNTEYFLDASRILAKMYFKYGLYRKAENNLMLLRDLDTDNTPEWVYVYSAATCYKNDLEYTLSHPTLFISYLKRASGEDHELIHQHVGILKDFLNSSTQFIKSKTGTNNISIGMKEILAYFEPLTEEVAEEWNNFLAAVQSNYIDNLDGSVTGSEQYNILMLLIQSQKTKISELEEKMEELNSDLLFTREAIEDIKQKYLDLGQPKYIEQIPDLQPDAPPEYITTGRKPNFLVFGSAQIPIDHMRGIAKNLGIDKDQLIFMLDYEDNKRFDFDKIRFSSPYGGILIGPNAHKMVGVAEYSSIIQKLTNEPGFPHIEEIKTISGELKITKSSFRDALRRMIAHVDSIGIN
jgi:hypothetical protein